MKRTTTTISLERAKEIARLMEGAATRPIPEAGAMEYHAKTLRDNIRNTEREHVTWWAGGTSGDDSVGINGCGIDVSVDSDLDEETANEIGVALAKVFSEHLNDYAHVISCHQMEREAEQERRMEEEQAKAEREEHPATRNISKGDIIRAMRAYGGGFIKSLAMALEVADSENTEKIRTTWPDEREKYTNFADTMRMEEQAEKEQL